MARYEIAPNSILIGANVRFEGTVTAAQQATVHGHVKGTLTAGHLVVGESGVLEGQISAQTMEVHGRVQEQVSCRALLHVHASGQVQGDVSYAQIQIERGGRLTGALKRPRS